MCGITGWINLESTHSQDHNEAVLHSMCERMVHRGPNSEGTWLEDFVASLNGMFAISLWDTRRKKLILVRDRFGEKPLYYGAFDGKLLYASEPKALLAHPSVKREIDLDAMRHYLSFDYVPAPHSIYKGISKLPAAHMLTVENGEIKTRRYWNQTFEKNGHARSIETAAS